MNDITAFTGFIGWKDIDILLATVQARSLNIRGRDSCSWFSKRDKNALEAMYQVTLKTILMALIAKTAGAKKLFLESPCLGIPL